MVGGAGFGTTPARALAVGADAWATSIEEAHRTANAWCGGAPPLARPKDDREQLALAADRQVLVEAAMADLAVHFPEMGAYSPWQVKKAREDLDYIVRFVEVALLTGDDTVIVEFVGWLVPLLAARGVPPSAVHLGIKSLGRCLPPEQVSAARLLWCRSSSGKANNPVKCGLKDRGSCRAKSDANHRSMPTYSRDTGTFFRRVGFAWGSPSVPTLGTSRREGVPPLVPITGSCCDRRGAGAISRLVHARAAFRSFIASLCDRG